MKYKVEFTKDAADDIITLKKKDPGAYKKLLRMLVELEEHPTTGTSVVKPLKGDKQGTWSRRITQRHRLVYEIHADKILVLVLSAYGHYYGA